MASNPIRLKRGLLTPTLRKPARHYPKMPREVNLAQMVPKFDGFQRPRCQFLYLVTTEWHITPISVTDFFPAQAKFVDPTDRSMSRIAALSRTKKCHWMPSIMSRCQN